MTKTQLYTMKWNNYQNHITEIFLQLLESETMVDLTLCAEGEKINCHKIVLSACSPYFQDILSTVQSSHPVVVLSGMSAEDVKSIIEFVYRGELNVRAERFSSVLKAAETLKISGLMEVNNHLPNLKAAEGEQSSSDCIQKDEDLVVEEVVTEKLKEEVILEESTVGIEPVVEDTIVPQVVNSTEPKQEIIQEDGINLEIAFPQKQEEVKKRKRRKENAKKDYSEDSLSAALNDLVAGRSLVETAAAHHIPRSTLYTRARAYGVVPIITRQEYSGDKISAAIQAVSAGASLQHASDLYGIPKTVLWRRVQKHIGSYALSRRAKLRQQYSPHVKEAAVRALEKGENMTKVATQYQIPKTTLFREKSRLVEAGKLPFSCLNRRANDGYRQMRLIQAVAACKEGKMSQAVASSTYNVPKTTIWRRLQQSALQNTEKQTSPSLDINSSNDSEQNVSEDQQTAFNFSQVVTEIPVSYIGEPDYSDASLIILTPGNGSDISLQENGEIINKPSENDQERLQEVVEEVEIQDTNSSHCTKVIIS